MRYSTCQLRLADILFLERLACQKDRASHRNMAFLGSVTGISIAIIILIVFIVLFLFVFQ